jgi:hypothetical protein
MTDPGWTIETLRAYVEVRLADLRLLLDERYFTQTKALDAAFVAAEKAVQTALASAEKAVAKAEGSVDNRLELLNELRSGVATTAQIEALEKEVAGIQSWRATTEGNRRGISTSWAIVLGVLGLAVALFLGLRQ